MPRPPAKGAHAKGAPGEGWGSGSTREWRRIRAQVLARDSHRCQLAIAGTCKTKADCVHHLYGKAVTGDNPRYLVAACTPCNLRVGDPQRGDSTGRGKHHDPPPTPRTKWLHATS